jgi:hypothetical protein
LTHWQWWQQKQSDYNKGLIGAGTLAFVIWCLLGSIFIAPHHDLEISVPIMVVQAIAYLMVMVVANVCYLMAFVVNVVFNRSNDHHFLSRLFVWVFWLSCALPNVVVLLAIGSYLIK